MTSFDAPGADWEVGEDGVPWRRAARVLLFSADGRLLLATSHDLHDPSRSWWFTLGGGLEPGEDARLAAVREVEEETGIEQDPDALLGPVATRSALLDFASGTVRQEEEYYLARLDGDVHLDRLCSSTGAVRGSRARGGPGTDSPAATARERKRPGARGEHRGKPPARHLKIKRAHR